MKQFLSIVGTGIIFCCFSCNNEKTSAEVKDNSMADKNLEASHVVGKAFQTGDVSMIDSVIAADFVDHTERGDMGRDSLKAAIIATHAMNKDMKVEYIKEFADNEYVMSWSRYSGTSEGGMGMPAGPYEMTAIETVRFKDGKAVEHWAFMEPREMMKMMQPPADAKMESADKMKKK